MSHRVHFLAFLGTSFYEFARYDKAGEITGASRFVQVPLCEAAQRVSNNEGLDFRATILLTDEARRLNWDDVEGGRAPKEGDPPQEYRGLRAELAALDISPNPVSIPNGNSDSQHWEIFGSLVDCVDAGDLLYIDVTHGFRSLPVLLTKALDYLRQVKGVSVEAIHYGVYERGARPQPIVDLSGFVVLGEWARAVSAFKRSGNLLALADEVQDVVLSVGKALRRDTPSVLRQLVTSLRRLGEALEHCHLHKVPQYADRTMTVLAEARGALAGVPGVVMLLPVLDVLEQEIAPLAPMKVGNSSGTISARVAQIAAARFLIERQRYLNAYAFLRETLADVVLDAAQADGVETGNRIAASEAALRPLIQRTDTDLDALPEGPPEGPIEAFVRRQAWHTEELIAFASAMTQRRNLLLHCGTGNDQIPKAAALRLTALAHVKTFEHLLPTILTPHG